PMGTGNCVMVIKDESGRILITHEVGSENGDDAGKFLQKLKDAGIIIVWDQISGNTKTLCKNLSGD
ncbi:hypothetical protein QUF80_20625, partial [Desulfococcaceae bacterium HSG8]|nr:hypothetical protein [Desulfococcaceae bacterium HSG8]